MSAIDLLFKGEGKSEKTDREIDERVYELYGITEAEKRLIER